MHQAENKVICSAARGAFSNQSVSVMVYHISDKIFEGREVTDMNITIKKSCVMTLILLMIITTTLASCGSSEPDWPAMKTLSEINAADVISIEYSRATEGGSTIESTEDATQIEDIILRLKEVSIKEETDKSTADDDLGIKIVAGDKSPTFSFEGDILVLEDGSRYEVENLSSLKSYIDKLIEENAGPAEAMHDTTNSGGSGKSYDAEKDNHMSGNFINDGKYSILDNLWENNANGMTYLYGNDFLLTMPNNSEWGFEQTSADSFHIFYVPTRDNGLKECGVLVTIKAYDINDDSYKDLPIKNRVAGVGKNTNKRFVAIYPSDVQFNVDIPDEVQGYQNLYSYLDKIGEGAVNSPFQTQDSN